MSETLQGHRIDSPFASDGSLIGEWPKPGDFYFCIANDCWCGVAPNGHMVSFRNHQVTEHDDGTITLTVNPSIQVHAGTKEVWHGYLERGVWRAL